MKAKPTSRRSGRGIRAKGRKTIREVRSAAGCIMELPRGRKTVRDVAPPSGRFNDRLRGRKTIGEVHADYMDLIRERPLRPIRDDRDYDAAAAMLDRLAVRPEGSLSVGERDYLETLTLLIEAYDQERFRIDTAHLTPLALLKYLMEEREMRSTDLGNVLGNQALASLILNGHRALSKTHMGILGEYFKVDPGLFLGDKPKGKRS